MTFDAFADIVRTQMPTDGRRLAVPVFRRRSADLTTPVAAFLKLRDPGTFGFLFESVEGGERLGRYSFLGKNPYLVVESRGDRISLHRPGGAVYGDGAPHGVETERGSIFEALARVLGRVEQARVDGLPRLTSGAVGYVAYDAVRQVEALPVGPPDALGLPDAVWGFYDTLLAFDHVRHQVVLMATAFVSEDTDLEAAYMDAVERIEDLESELDFSFPEPGDPVCLLADAPTPSVSKDDFEATVRTAKQHIVDGDIFQVVLSQRFAMPFTGDRFNLYRALRQVNPSPYLFYLDIDGLDVPERRLHARRLQPRGLDARRPAPARRRAGRAPSRRAAHRRHAPPRRDAAGRRRPRRAELLADPKERAEHLMLVDLGRNDVGRVSRPGSVRVDRYAEVERFSHVMHLVSSVSGDVEGRDALDVLAACFPAGTVSGAPKVRAMEIIDALEPVRRGPYAGAVGYAGFDGALDTCIAIRTMLVTEDAEGNQTASVQAGAGIVADSDPAAEHAETHAKAAALFAAMRSATERPRLG